jgi:low affinity Fe/Cu permease
MTGRISKFFSAFSNWLAKWMGSHWAFVGAAILVLVGLLTLGVEDTNIAISVVTLLMVFVLQNTQNRDSAALHLKLDEIITHLHGPRDELAGVESKSHEEIEELRMADGGVEEPPSESGLVQQPGPS